jgi:hypothetical protein
MFLLSKPTIGRSSAMISAAARRTLARSDKSHTTETACLPFRFTSFFNWLSFSRPRPTSRTSDRVQTALAYAKEDLSDSLSVDALAKVDKTSKVADGNDVCAFARTGDLARLPITSQPPKRFYATGYCEAGTGLSRAAEPLSSSQPAVRLLNGLGVSAGDKLRVKTNKQRSWCRVSSPPSLSRKAFQLL